MFLSIRWHLQKLLLNVFFPHKNAVERPAECLQTIVITAAAFIDLCASEGIWKKYHYTWFIVETVAVR